MYNAECARLLGLGLQVPLSEAEVDDGGAAAAHRAVRQQGPAEPCGLRAGGAGSDPGVHVPHVGPHHYHPDLRSQGAARTPREGQAQGVRAGPPQGAARAPRDGQAQGVRAGPPQGAARAPREGQAEGVRAGLRGGAFAQLDE
eukprot:5427988-Pyramimonas_sp.AAC.1